MEGQDIAADELTDGEKIARVVLEICSATLSVAGSSIIVFKILRDRALYNSMTPYDRIILGLSSCDVFASISYAINEFLMPREESLNPWAVGTPATCQALGAVAQLSQSAIWYNCLLSYYFLLTVLSQVKRKNLVRKFELWMHLSVIWFPITAILGLYNGWYGTIITSCHFTDLIHHWIFGGIPFFFTIISLIINNILIFAIVRKSLRSSSEQTAGRLSAVQKRLKRESSTLMFLYVGCFFLSSAPTIAMLLIEEYFDPTIRDLYPSLVLDAIFWPLQGFFNFLIYIRPMYTRYRAAHPEKSIYYVLHEAVRNPKAPRLNHRRVGHHITHASVYVTDITLGEDGVMNPNEALFYPGVLQLSSSSESPSNNLSEGDNEGIVDSNIRPSLASSNHLSSREMSSGAITMEGWGNSSSRRYSWTMKLFSRDQS